MELFPAFKLNIVPPSYDSCQDEYKLVTEQVTINNKKKLVAVAKLLDHESANKGLKAQDFDLVTLIATGQEANLRPAALLSLSPLAQVDMISKQSSVLMDAADLQIAQEKLKDSPAPSPAPSPVSLSESAPTE